MEKINKINVKCQECGMEEFVFASRAKNTHVAALNVSQNLIQDDIQKK